MLFIDEAQDLDQGLLEQIRLLSNLETDQRKLLQIVLIGQPELREKLNDRGLRQLRQRITVRYHLTPLTRDDTERYIAHRLRVAGANGRPAFTRWAIRTVHRYARGIPRLVNAVCDKALLYGYVNGFGEARRAEHPPRDPRARGNRMSLIDEALKRARDQQLPAAPAQDGSKSGRPVDPWAYAPLPHVRRRSVALPGRSRAPSR